MRTLHDGRYSDEQDDRVPRYVCVKKDAFLALQHRITCSAFALDREVTRRVGEALSPISLGGALEIIQTARDQADAEERGRRRELSRLEDEIADLKRQLRHLGPERQRLRVELEEDADQGIHRRDNLKRELSRRQARPEPSFTPADAAEIVVLTGRFNELWNAPTTTNDDRKRLIRTIISRIIVTAARDASRHERVEAEIVWVGGHRERCEVLKPSGVAKLAVALRKAGRSTREIAAQFEALGITTATGRAFSRKTLQHALWALGLGTKDDRLKALRLIRSMLLERRSRREMLETLRSQGPQPSEGEWTPSRLQSAIQSLRRNLWPDEVPPLPPDVPTLRRLPPEAIEIIRQGRAAGRTFKAIAPELNLQGFRTPRGRAFTAMGLYQLYQHLEADGVLDDAARLASRPPSESSETGPTWPTS